MKTYIQLDELIKKGDIETAKQHLLNINSKNITRSETVPYASLFRRVGESFLGIKLLQKYIKSNNKICNAKPTEEELLEYGACLVNNLAINKGIAILSQIDVSKHPKANLFLAFANFYKWEHKQAIPLLEKNISSNLITEYEKLIGELNLLMAYVHVKETEKADKLIFSLENKINCESQKWLYINLLKVKAENLYNKKLIADAYHNVKVAESLLDKANTIEHFYIKRWICVFELSLNKNEENINKLKALYQEAVNLGYHEVARDIDFHLCIITKDQNIFNKLYFGTPHRSYRERLVSEASWAIIPDSYIYQIQKDVVEDFQEIDLALITNETNNITKLLNIFLRDFYAPKTTMEIYELLFKNEKFNPHSTKNKIYQLIDRLNNFLNENKIELKVISQESKYFIIPQKSVSIKIDNNRDCLSDSELFYAKILNNFSLNEFTLNDLASLIKIPERTVSYKLKKLADDNKIRKIGSGKKTKYCLTNEGLSI